MKFADITIEEEGVKKILHSLVNLKKKSISLEIKNVKLLIDKESDSETIVIGITLPDNTYYAFPINKERIKDIRMVSYRKATMVLLGLGKLSYNSLFLEYKKLI